MNANHTLDESFDAGLSAVSSMLTAVVQADGKVLVQGSLYLADGSVLPSVTRLNEDGSVDDSFQLPENIGVIHGVTLLPETQKIMLNGLLLPTNNVASAVLLRLESDGSIDASFTSAVKQGYFSLVQPLSEGKLLVEGSISLSSEPATSSSYPMRPPRSPRPEQTNSFQPLPGWPVQPGTNLFPKIPSTLNPRQQSFTLASSESYRWSRLWRLNADGSLDETFSSAAIPDQPITPGPQGMMYAGVTVWTEEETVFGTALERYLPSGEKDAGFAPVFEGAMPSVSVIPLSTGQILVSFQRTNVLQTPSPVIVVLSNDGSIEAEVESDWNLFYWRNGWLERSESAGILLLGPHPAYGFRQGKLLQLLLDGQIEVVGVPPFEFSDGKVPYPRRNGEIYLQHARANSSGIHLPGLSRLRKSGAVDVDFDPALGETNWLYSPTFLDSGDLIVGVASTNGYITGVARLNSLGETVRTMENESLNYGQSPWVVFPDGRIAIANGDSIDAANDPYLRFYTADFELESELIPESEDDSYLSYNLRLTPDGSLLAMTSIQVVSFESEDVYIDYRMKRILPAGTLDPTFQRPANPAPYFAPNVMDHQGRLYTYTPSSGGGASRVRSTPSNALPPVPATPPIQRHLADGSIDQTFHTTLPAGSGISQLTLQKDGKLLAAGVFFSADGTKISTLMRLLPDGSVDESFVPPGGEVVPIYSIAVEADGNILVGGAFDRIGGEERPGLARLKSMEQPQMKNVTFTEGSLRVQLDGNTGRTWHIQASDDLASWTTVATVTTGTSTETVELPAPGGGNKFYRAVLAP